MALLFTTTNAAKAGDGTKENPYTVAELNAQKNALATSGQVVWVKADLKGLGEDGKLSETGSDSKDTNNLAGLFGDATGQFVAYSWQILGQLALADLTNTKDLLISLTYGTAGHPFGNTANPQYASNYEPATDHFSLEEVHGALTLNIENGMRGYHIASAYIIPADVVAIKVSAGYSASKGAYVNCDNEFKGAEQTYVTPKNTALVLLATEGTHDFVLSAALNEQTMSNGNNMNAGTAAGVNTITTKNRWHYRFVATADKVGFERNSDTITEVVLESKDEIFLSVNSLETNFAGNFAFETADKKWISWNGKKITDYDITPTNINASPSTIRHQPSAIHDLQGRRVIKPSKGIYVKDNKTVYIK